MTWETWIAFCVLETVLCITPGPAVLFVVSTRSARGPRAGLSGALGIVAANTVYFVLSALGVAAIILASDLLVHDSQVGRRRISRLARRAYAVVARAGKRWSEQAAAPPALSASLLRGFAVQAANPKALAFFVALLPQFVTRTPPSCIRFRFSARLRS